MKQKRSLLTGILLLGLLFGTVHAQNISGVQLSVTRGVGLSGYTDATGKVVAVRDTLPLFTFELGDSVLVNSREVSAVLEGDSIRWSHSSGINGSVKWEKN